MPVDIPPSLPPQACIELQTQDRAYGFERGQVYGPGVLLAFRCDGNAAPAAVVRIHERHQWTAVFPLRDLMDRKP